MSKLRKLKMTIELEYDADLMHGNDKDAVNWFFKDILMQDKLFLHSNEMGDVIGEVTVLKVKSDFVLTFTNVKEELKRGKH